MEIYYCDCCGLETEEVYRDADICKKAEQDLRKANEPWGYINIMCRHCFEQTLFPLYYGIGGEPLNPDSWDYHGDIEYYDELVNEIVRESRFIVE